MIRTMLQAKLHRAIVTQVDLHYEGSCGIDESLLKMSGLLNNQHVDIYNVSNGARFTTYIIPAPAGSGEISLNGASARLVAVGDIVIICSYAAYDESEMSTYEPIVISLDEKNRPTLLRRHGAALASVEAGTGVSAAPPRGTKGGRASRQ